MGGLGSKDRIKTKSTKKTTNRNLNPANMSQSSNRVNRQRRESPHLVANFTSYSEPGKAKQTKVENIGSKKKQALNIVDTATQTDQQTRDVMTEIERPQYPCVFKISKVLENDMKLIYSKRTDKDTSEGLHERNSMSTGMSESMYKYNPQSFSSNETILTECKSLNDVETLSAKKLKELLMNYKVKIGSYCEKSELIRLAQDLWQKEFEKERIKIATTANTQKEAYKSSTKKQKHKDNKHSVTSGNCKNSLSNRNPEEFIQGNSQTNDLKAICMSTYHEKQVHEKTNPVETDLSGSLNSHFQNDNAIQNMDYNMKDHSVVHLNQPPAYGQFPYHQRNIQPFSNDHLQYPIANVSNANFGFNANQSNLVGTQHIGYANRNALQYNVTSDTPSTSPFTSNPKNRGYQQYY